MNQPITLKVLLSLQKDIFQLRDVLQEISEAYRGSNYEHYMNPIQKKAHQKVNDTLIKFNKKLSK